MGKSVVARALLALFFSIGLSTNAAEKKPAPGPELRSANALIVDANSGDVIYERDAGRPVPIASITKLMTALVVLDGQQPLDEKVEITVHGKGSVPEFEGSVQMPPRLVLTAPELEEPACQGVDPESVTPVPIDPSDDFKVTWSSDREDDIDILFMFDDIKDYEGDEDRERSTLVRCLYTADEGEAVIPEEVLASMPSGSGSFTIRQIVKHAELADDWLLTLGSYWEMCSPVTLE